MILDLIIAAILIITAIYGYKKGFVYTLIHTAGWAVALAAAYFGTGWLSPLVKEHTSYYDWLMEGFTYRFDSLTGIQASEDSIPSGISSVLGNVTNSISDGLATAFSTLVFSITIFAAIFIIVKIVLWLILRVLSKEYNGHVGGVDGFFGVLIGLVKGVILVFIFLALLLPAINLMAPDFTEGVTAALKDSYIAKTLYDNNLLLILLQSAFTS
ncbi:MAG: CvpA family protein [Eubacteriaceae bacterium]|nr:CvpA family protein [Eubacteriaceae bacterium]